MSDRSTFRSLALATGLMLLAAAPAWSKVKKAWDLTDEAGSERARAAATLRDKRVTSGLKKADKDALRASAAESTAMCTEWLVQWAQDGKIKKNPFKKRLDGDKLTRAIDKAAKSGSVDDLLAGFDKISKGSLAFGGGKDVKLTALDKVIKKLDPGLY
ncbi:MAG: hypothetical protein ACYS22_19370, partial [Planctomycetota bacterium]